MNISAMGIDDCTKDGGQEYFFKKLSVTLNFDRFDWLISSIPQRILIKKFFDAIISAIVYFPPGEKPKTLLLNAGTVGPCLFPRLGYTRGEILSLSGRDSEPQCKFLISEYFQRSYH